MVTVERFLMDKILPKGYVTEKRLKHWQLGIDLLPWDHLPARALPMHRGFLRCFRGPRIENRVPRIRENYHRVPI